MFSDPAPGTTSSSDEEDAPPRASSAHDHEGERFFDFTSLEPGRVADREQYFKQHNTETLRTTASANTKPLQHLA